MFNEKKFYGKHADYVNFLCKDRGQDTKDGINLFQTKIELYILAPIIGLIYNRKSDIDYSTNSTYTIQLQQIMNYESDLEYVYRMVMLLDDKDNISEEQRLNRAFRFDNDKTKFQENMKIFDKYVLGGIEVIYEQFSNDLGDREQLLFDLLEFLDFNEE